MSGERTEPPTPKRLREARRRGEVARSADLTGALVLVAGGLGALGLAPGAARRLRALATVLLGDRAVSVSSALVLAGKTALHAAGPLLALLAAVGIAGSLLQTGPLVATEALRPDPSRLHPGKGLRRLFSFQRLGVILKTAAAFAVVSLVLRALVRPRLGWLLALPRLGAAAAGAMLFHLAATLVAASGGALLALGAADLALARHRHLKQLRMTRQEVREEHKRDEGDPSHKAERRKAHRALLAGPARPLREAAVVVVNPTHVSVALHFDDTLDAPVVGVRGTGAGAARIRAGARRHGIPLVRDVPLARALLAVDPGAEVPEALYAAVAAVLTAVHRVARRGPDRSLP